jgi:hypothetical protein
MPTSDPASNLQQPSPQTSTNVPQQRHQVIQMIPMLDDDASHVASPLALAKQG